MNTSTIGADLAASITEFAAAVRAHLADLPKDEADELTDGLEADLTDRAVDDPAAPMPDPVAYAAELRAAAGYPPVEATRRRFGEGVRSLDARIVSGWKDLLEKNPSVRAAVDFFVVLRPVWWVLRAAAAYALLGSLVGPGAFGPIGWLVLSGLVVVSVQWGRGRWMPWGWLPRAILIGNIIVVLFTPALLGLAVGTLTPQAVVDDEWVQPMGLTLNGAPVGNIFAYDAAGNPIEQVQLFDQEGNPLNLVDPSENMAWVYDEVVVPSSDVPGRAGWNVYPLRTAEYDDQGDFGLGESIPSRFPLDEVRALSGAHDEAVDDDAALGDSAER